MKNIAIIPARGGSKRIPRKNIKDFLGEPIISYSIDASIKSNLFDEIMVSTDDEEVANIAIKYGAKVPFFRSRETSDDNATTIDVLKEVCNIYGQKGFSFNHVCCIYPCSPFVTPKLLLKSYNRLFEGNYDCVFPIVKYSHPIQRALIITEKDKIQMLNAEYMQTRTQDLQSTYHDLGMFYFFKPENVLSIGKLWTDNTGYIELKESDSQDIDNIEDWELAELKFRSLKIKGRL